MVKEWGGFVGGSRFKSQWGQKFTYKKIHIYIAVINCILVQDLSFYYKIILPFLFFRS